MKAVGLITEYNPFHNGHLHHLRESLRVTGADVSVAVMSGHFLQRGEPALMDKWVRTEMALAAGVDLVLELPFPFACNSAPHFATGAVRALEALGRVDSLCFGSESGSLEELQRCADLLHEQCAAVSEQTAGLLRQGIPYPEARARILAQITGISAVTATLQTPNNILGIEYLKALRTLGSSLRPFTIPRIGAGYHDEEARGEIASATGIRRMLAGGEDASRYLPETVRPVFIRALATGRVLEEELLHRLLLGRLLRGPASLGEIYQVEDGLENRLFEEGLKSVSWADLASAVKSRHFTLTRIQRVLAFILNDIRREEMEEQLQQGPFYLHVLGFNSRGKAFLASCRKTRTLPIVQNFSRIGAILKRFYGNGTEDFRRGMNQLEWELRATRTYTLLMRRWEGGNRNRDFYEEPRVKNQ